MVVLDLLGMYYLIMNSIERNSLSDFLFFISLSYNFKSVFSSVADKVKNIVGNKNIYGTYYKFFNIPDVVNEEGQDVWDSKRKYIVEFENVWFKYKPELDWVIKGVSFKIAWGDDLAIIGQNGSGKTTLVKLILGIYKPNKGYIRINGVDINSGTVSLRKLYRKISLMGQGQGVPEVKAIDVITSTMPGKPFEQERLDKVAKMSVLEPVLEKLNGDFNTWINPGISGGTNLSGGEKQRLVIASVFYKDAELYILDEPTSAIDPITDRKIMSNFWSMTEDKSVIIISHRVKSISKADNIIVMEGGSIVAVGNHQELIDSSDLYKEMRNAVD